MILKLRKKYLALLLAGNIRRVLGKAHIKESISKLSLSDQNI